ncbi:hypothetical protein COCON_G00128530 [Conger conger]|uniref:Uncharacterized protein n=1 Tax=Conger conger TaxID=82655 RepID=A0A9Q1DDZ1_CONCO|nr:hypothetical protein COCON_G00128530 [Conger conger]
MHDTQTRLSLSNGPQRPGFLSMDMLKSCGYPVSNEEKNMTVLVKDCDVMLLNGQCSTRIKYETVDGQLADVTLPCTARHPRSPDLVNFDGLQSDSPNTGRKCDIPRDHYGPRCNFDKRQRIPCGVFSSVNCLAKGCCYDDLDHSCTYPMNECTAEKRFVFVIYRNHSALALDLTKLKTSGASDCAPKILTTEFAVFSFASTDCGVRSYVVGESVILSVEVVTSVSSLPAINGSISRDIQYRLMVECRYGSQGQPSDLSHVASAGFMVKSPHVHPLVRSEGFFNVQLKIAKDAGFKKYFPKSHQPLRYLLGKPVYLQVSLRARNPTVTLLVHYCIAYPKSATKALVLLHNGCPNPLDHNGVVIIRLPGNKYMRRFVIKAFQFMDAPNEYLDEQIYFLCSTELCFHKNRMVCKEGCFLVGH